MSEIPNIPKILNDHYEVGEKYKVEGLPGFYRSDIQMDLDLDPELFVWYYDTSHIGSLRSSRYEWVRDFINEAFPVNLNELSIYGVEAGDNININEGDYTLNASVSDGENNRIELTNIVYSADGEEYSIPAYYNWLNGHQVMNSLFVDDTLYLLPNGGELNGSNNMSELMSPEYYDIWESVVDN